MLGYYCCKNFVKFSLREGGCYVVPRLYLAIVYVVRIIWPTRAVAAAAAAFQRASTSSTCDKQLVRRRELVLLPERSMDYVTGVRLL